MERHLGIGIESSYGVAVAPTLWLEVRRESVRRIKNTEQIPSIRSVSTRRVVLLNEYYGGDVEFTFDFQTFGMLAYWFFGVAPDTTGSGPHSHTFPPSTGLASDSRIGVSATIECLRASALNWRYAGAKLVGLSLQGSPQGVCVGTLSVIGKSETMPSAATASYLDFDIAAPKDIDVKFDASSVGPRSFKLNMNWPVDLPFLLGDTAFGVEPDDDGELAVSGDVVSLCDDSTEYDLFAANSEVDVQIELDDGTHSLTANMNKTRLLDGTPPAEGRKRLVQTHPFLSYYDSDATENLQVVVVNDDVAIP